MARIARRALVFQGSLNHCVWRAIDRSLVFDIPGARDHFRSLLLKYKSKFGVLIYAYCFMGNHPHVICRASHGQASFSAFWKVVNQCFAHWYNRHAPRKEGGHAEPRRGQVIMERMRSPLIQDDQHALTVMRYADLNPVRAGLVRSPGRWRWSSFRHYAFGQYDDLVDDAPSYLALGTAPHERRQRYLHLFASPLTEVLRQRRADLSDRGFVGEATWVASRLATLAMPRRPAVAMALGP